MNIEFPDAFDELSDSMTFLNYDMVNVASALCYYKADYYDVLQVQFWWPTILILLLVLDHWRERKMDPDDPYAGVAHIKAIIMVLFTAYPLSALVYLKFFLCREIDGEWFLQADYRYQCFDDKWNGYLALAVPGVVVYLVGTPIFFVLTLCGVIMYVLKCSATQVTVSIIFACLFLIVSLHTSPFKNNDLNQGEMLTRSATLVTLFVALLLKVEIYDIDDWSEGILSGILMCVNLVVICLFVYRFIRVQGNFLCETYCPDFLARGCLACNQWLGWKPGPQTAPADGGKNEPAEVEQVPLLVVQNLKKPSSFQERTFKCVS
jgi:hypothetical protein